MSAQPNPSPRVVGVDLGGDALRLASWVDGEPRLLPSRPVAEPLHREIRVNGAAPECRILSLKRLLDHDETLILPRVGGASIRSVEYLTELFRLLRTNATLFPASTPLNTVGAVPPCFSQRQRSTFREAIEKAGFERVRLVDDTMAAVLANQERLRGKESVLVYAWGASTFSAALYRPAGTAFRVIAQDGDRNLGGDDWNGVILNGCLKALGRPVRFPSKDDAALLRELERIKRVLSDGQEAQFSTVVLVGGRPEAQRIPPQLAVDASAFREAVLRMTQRTLELSEKVLREGKCPEPEVVLLLGGVTSAPLVTRAIEQRFPGRILATIPDAVAVGAAIYGTLLPSAEWEASGRRAEQDKQRGLPPAAKPPAATPDPDPSPAPRLRAPDRAPETPARPAVEGGWAAHFVPLLNEAERLEKEDRLDESVAKLEELHERMGKFFFWVFDKAATTQMAQGHKERAYALLQRANRFDPSNERVAHSLAEFYGGRAVELYKNRRFESALESCRAALAVIEALPDAERRQGRFLAHYLRLQAEIELALSRTSAAEANLERAVRLNPEEPALKQRLQEIQPLLKRAASEVRRVFGPMSGEDRNRLCPCGSGKKYKKCCGR